MPHTEGNTASLWIYCKLLPTFWVKRRRYLVESESPLKGSISDGHRDVVHCSLFQQVMHLVRSNIELRGKRWASTLSEENPARLTPSTWRIWSPNLRPPSAAGEPLVTRQTKTPAQANLQLKSCSNVGTFVNCLHPEPNLAIGVLAENNLPHPMGDLGNDFHICCLKKSYSWKCLIWLPPP